MGDEQTYKISRNEEDKKLCSELKETKIDVIARMKTLHRTLLHQHAIIFPTHAPTRLTACRSDLYDIIPSSFVI